MVYETKVASDDHQEGDSSTETTTNRHLISWDSSLSPSPEATRMRVEVVGIYTDIDDDDDNNTQKQPSSTAPNMAMVVVHKESTSVKAFQNLPPMLQNLFQDSEKRILKALDRGLDDFVAGKIEFKAEPRRQQVSSKRQSAEQAMLADLMDDDDDLSEAKATRNPPANVLDADIVADKPPPLTATKEQARPKEKNEASMSSKREAVLQTMNSGVVKAKKEENISAPGLDFAVQAAKQAAAKREQSKEDFAVAAARKSAAKRPPSLNKTTEPPQTEDTDAGEMIDPASIDLTSIRPPIIDQDATGSRAFMQTISRPTDRSKKESNAFKQEPVSDKAGAPVDMSDSSNPTVGDDSLNGTAKRQESSDKNVDNTVMSNDGDPESAKVFPTDEEIQKVTQEVLEEMAQGGRDMTPEELLDDVLKYGDQQEKDNTEGSGFVSGAFEMAKEILREQQQTRDERLRKEVVSRVTADMKGVAPDVRDIPETRVMDLSPEEELRRMFEAGERIADGRITLKTDKDIATRAAEISTADNEVIDSVIATDRTISGHARVLDDELAELEVRINKSPGEEFDSPFKNPMFDIFSGPELYNPNVDPETSVNWPGALPGTKNIRLPKELGEAVRQAEFAFEVLTSLKESEDDNGQKKYWVSERELTQQQVDNLRTAVMEAVEIGILADPLALMSERSRIQMLLDELRDQPEERLREVASNYKDLLLSNNFVALVKERLTSMADRDLEALRQDDDSLDSVNSRERELLGQLVVYAQLLLKETRALGAELEAQQLEVIRSICKVAMNPAHKTEEETAEALSAVVRDMRPLFDEGFIAYLKYAVAEEEGRLARAGLLDDPEHNQWLFVLKIVQQGVYSEIAQGINRYIDHIGYILRMETPSERRMLLTKLIDVMPTLDVRPFVQVVENIAGSLGDSAAGEFSDFATLGEMTNKILQLHRDVRELLPPDRIALMSRDADEWVAERKRRLLEQQNQTRQRLRASRQTEHREGEIDSLGRRGEMERIE
jgi:hypothetical protein